MVTLSLLERRDGDEGPVSHFFFSQLNWFFLTVWRTFFFLKILYWFFFVKRYLIYIQIS